MDRGAWWAIVPGVAKSQKQLSDWTGMQYSLWTLLGVHRTCQHFNLSGIKLLSIGASLVSQIKESACNAWDPTSIPGLGTSLEEGNGNQLQYSCLENPMDKGAWWTTIHCKQSDTTEWLKLSLLSISLWMIISRGKLWENIQLIHLGEKQWNTGSETSTFNWGWLPCS